MCYGRTQQHILPHLLQLSCWNINGLGKRSVFDNKLLHSDFLNSIKNCGFLILSEIWGHEALDIPGFDIISVNCQYFH